MRSEFLPFSPPSIGEDEIAEVVDSLRSGWITTGPKVKQFEAAFAEAVEAPASLALSSCTDALQIALAAFGVGPGDAVFTTAMTFVASAHVVEHVGATPVLVDIDPVTLNIDPSLLEAAITATAAAGALRPRAIIPVHYSGHACDMAAIYNIARRHGLAVVEDAAHALPARFPGAMVGTPQPDLEHAVAFSFYATKNLTTAEGGALTGSAELLAEARLWSLHGMSRDAWNRYGEGGSWFYEVIRPGYKCNMTDLQAAIGLHQLRRLPDMQRRRGEVVDRYRAGLADVPEVELPTELAGYESALHLFVLRLHEHALTIGRNDFIDGLAKRKIGASVHFIPVHVHPYYRDRYGWVPEDFPVAWREYQRMVSLPLHPGLTDADVDDVVEAVRDLVADHRR